MTEGLPIVRRLNLTPLYAVSGELSDLPDEAADLICELVAALEPFPYWVDKWGVKALKAEAAAAHDALTKARGE
jgi:hypothetical protein